MILSVLVCSVAERFDNHALDIQRQLYTQTTDQVEVIVLTDNRRMTIGAKRNHLVSMASGEYVVFVDDDDTIADDYISQLLGASKSGADVLTFTMQYLYNGSPGWLVRQSLTHPVHGHRTPGTVFTCPRHTSAVKRDLALRLPFVGTSYGEDREWADRLKGLARTEYVIPETLYYYNDTPRTSVARQYAHDYDPAAYNEWKAAQ